MRLTVLLFCAIPLLAVPQSSNTISGAQATNLVGGGFATAGASSQRWELRVHDVGNLPGGYVANLAEFAIFIGGGAIQFTYAVNPPVVDTIVGAPQFTCCTGINDIELRLMRDVPNLLWTFQMCITATGVCQTTTSAITSLGNTTTHGGATANDWTVLPFNYQNGYDFAWIRWFSTLVDPATQILNTNTGTVLDWEFEGNQTDSVLGLVFSGTTVAYTNTPVYNPVCRPLAQQTFIVGVTGSVTAVNLCQPLDGGSTLTPLWTYAGTGADGVNQSTISLGTASALTTTVSGLIKGSVNLNLAVTDGSSNTTTVTLHDGAVAVTGNDLVVTGLPAAQDAILGPLLRYGSPYNRVPWFDDRNKALLDLQGPALSTNFPDYWDSFASGTVAVSPTQTCGNSPAGQGIIGTGTAFKSIAAFNYTASSTSNTPAGTGTYTFTVASGLGYQAYMQPSNPNMVALASSLANPGNFIYGVVQSYSGTTLVISVDSSTGGGTGGSGAHTDWNIISPQYNVVAWNSGANRSLSFVQAVTSDTCMIIQYAWPVGYSPNTESGLQYTGPIATLGSWQYAQASTPGNYYDNVKAYRSFYERSGIDLYWTYYTYMADNGWANPPIDKGLAYSSGYAYLYATRSQSLEGFMIRAGDSGKSGMWTGLDYVITNNIGIVSGTLNWISADTRDTAYALEYLGLGALYSPISGDVTTYKAAISTAIPRFALGVQANGNIPNLELTITDTTHPVTVTNGSTAVSCSGCTFYTGFNGGGTGCPTFVTFTPQNVIPATNAPFSSVYCATYVDPTHITLTRPYAEASSVGNNTGFGYTFGETSPGALNGNVLGWGNQPFMVGIQTVALMKAANAIAVSDPTNSASATSMASGDSNWLTTRGYADPAHSGTGGMYYFQDYLPCAFPVQTTVCTENYNQSQSRTDAAEATRGLFTYYQAAPVASRLTFIRKLIDQMFCKPGFAGAGTTCATDGYYISDLDNGQGFMSSSGGANKWLGFFFGWSNLINPIAISAQVSSGSGVVFLLMIARQ